MGTKRRKIRKSCKYGKLKELLEQNQEEKDSVKNLRRDVSPIRDQEVGVNQRGGQRGGQRRSQRGGQRGQVKEEVQRKSRGQKVRRSPEESPEERSSKNIVI